MEGRNVGTVGGKSPKQCLISAKDLPMELPEGYEFPYHRLDKITNLTYSLIYGPWGLYSIKVIKLYRHRIYVFGSTEIVTFIS